MNIFQKAFMNYALGRPYVKTAVNHVVNNNVDKALNKEVSKISTRIENDLSKIQKRSYVTSFTDKSFDAKEYPSSKNYNTLEILFSESPGSIQCADRIINSVVGTGYTIKPIPGAYTKKKDLKILTDFFDKVNAEGETIEEFVASGIEAYLEYGNWYFEKVPTKNKKKLAEIYNLNSKKMKILVNAEKKKRGVFEKLGYQQETATGKKIIYDLDEVAHVRARMKNAGLYGDAVLEKNSSVLLMIISALQYNNGILNNGGYIPFQITLPEDSNESDAEAVSAYIEKNHMGSHNAGKPIVAFKGAEIKPLGISPSDMQYLDLLNFGIKQVAGMYGVPLILIGIPEGSNRSTSTTTAKSYYHTVVFPLRDKISQILTNEIIRKGFGIEGWKFNFKTAGLEESESTRRDTMNAFRTGIITFNEARTKMGQQPIEDKWANNYYLVSSKNDTMFEMPDIIEETKNNLSKLVGGGKTDEKEPEDNREQGQGAEESEE